MWALRRSASGAPILLLSLPLLGVARLLPAYGFGLWLRIVAASLVLLLPGALVARALRLRGASATVAWGLGALGPALVLVFVVHGSILLALVVLGVVGVVALPFALRVVSGPPAWDTLAIAFLGLAFGVALWHVAGVVTGDALFHLGRVQKLYSFGDLHVRSVDEFADGGLHPGYAFPLWHAFLALVAKVGGVGPTQVMLHEPSAIAPVAFAVVYEAGLALFRSVWLGAAVLTATVSAVALAPGHGGSFALLSQPGTLDRHVLVAVALTLFFLFLRHPGWALGLSLAAIGVEVLLVHTSTAVFLGVPLLGFAVARVLLTRSDARSSATALAALFLPAGAALAWLLPLVRETASHSPSRDELERALAKYGQRAERRLAASLRTSAGGDLARRRRRGGGARARSTRRVRRAAALGGLRARRNARRTWNRAASVGVPALRGRGLGFAGAASGRVRPDSVCARRRSSGAHRHGRPARASCRARRGHRSAAGVSRRLRARAGRGRPCARDLDRGDRRSGRDRRRPTAGAQDRSPHLDRHRRDRALLHPRCGARLPTVVACSFRGSIRTDARAPARSAHEGARAGNRLLRSRDQLPDRCVRAGVRRGRAAGPRGRHGFQSPVQTPPRSHPLLPLRASSRSSIGSTPTGSSWTSAASTSGFPGSSSTRISATRSTIGPDESAARDDVLPALRRRRRAAPAEVRNASARARDRDARARAGRCEVDPLRSRPRAADSGVDPPRPLPRAPLAQARGRAARPARARPAVATGAFAVSPRARAGRERRLEPDGDPGGGSHRARRRDRRGAHDLAAELGASHRRRGEADHRSALGRRPP